ncbi:MAG: hypothetical protein DRI69_01020 [Bacteroidetes bacterium]|nr:MAG: hypothetical protein DRI69_01020 [Bacteroidota bacterium]
MIEISLDNICQGQKPNIFPAMLNSLTKTEVRETINEKQISQHGMARTSVTSGQNGKHLCHVWEE